MTLMQTVHFYCTAPLLVLIALLARKRTLLPIAIVLMGLAPILANIGNMLIVSVVQEKWLYFPEIYLSIIWVFVISGLPFRAALISGTAITLIQTLFSTTFLMLNAYELTLHLFWLLAALLFGIGSALLFERLYKKVYEHYYMANQLACTDSTTNLPNKLSFDKEFSAQLDACKESRCNITLLMINCNDIEQINHNYGHKNTDQLLSEMAHCMAKQLPKGHQLARFEGSTFIALLYDLSLQQSLKFAHTISETIAAHTFVCDIHTSVSIGMTLYQYDDTLERIYDRGFNALKQAQKEGRNSVILH